MIREINDHQQNWQLAIPAPAATNPAAALVTMLRLLWQGQTDRHGGSAPTIPVTNHAAEVAVHLAVTLVQWFQTGAIQPTHTPPSRN
ncbi:MAG: hypothetical protein JO309_05060 [Pseudonocardiales bacterium]|nr:hypothetical protein [Pseudonocardiales bacterium]MBV9728766.1 hypothetical protein [Pseudonocardiales bacterium]